MHPDMPIEQLVRRMHTRFQFGSANGKPRSARDGAIAAQRRARPAILVAAERISGVRGVEDHRYLMHDMALRI